MSFLPNVEVTTLLWASDVELDWYAAQGDDLAQNRSTIELNLVKMVRDADGDVEKVTQLLIDNWLSIYIVLCTRLDLINKKIRGAVSEEGHQLLYTANLATIKASPILDERYTRFAIAAIRNGRPYLGLPTFGDIYQRVLEQMDNVLALMEANAVLKKARAEQYLRDIGLKKED